MIIKSNTPEGQKAKIFNKDGTEVTLPIKEYDTETKTALCYEMENGKVKMTGWKAHEQHKTLAVREPILVEVLLEGSYAEIDGKRV